MRVLAVMAAVVAVGLAGCLAPGGPDLDGPGAEEEDDRERERYNDTRGHDFIVKGSTDPPCHRDEDWQWGNYYPSPYSGRILACWDVPSPNASHMRWRLVKPTQGELTVKVRDGSGDLYYDEHWGQGAGSDCRDEDLPGEPGRWTVNVTVRNLQGRVRILFHTDGGPDCPS